MIIDISIKNLHGSFQAKPNLICMDGKYNPSRFIMTCNRNFSLLSYYIHPDSPQTGAQWMKQSLLFNKVKITNNPMQNSHQVKLFSSLRYNIFCNRLSF